MKISFWNRWPKSANKKAGPQTNGNLARPSETDAPPNTEAETDTGGFHYSLSGEAKVNWGRGVAIATAVATALLLSFFGIKGRYQHADEAKAPARTVKFAEITSPNPNTPVPAEIPVKGPLRGVHPDDKVYIESETEEHQFFYRQVQFDNERFWYNRFHPGMTNADYGKTFRLRIFVPRPGTVITREPYKTPLAGEYISAPVVYVREHLIAAKSP